MKFKKLNSKKEVNVDVARYKIDWENSVSRPQKRVKDFLFPHWKAHVCMEEFRIPGSRLRFDIVNLTSKIILEISPSGSHRYNAFFHKNRSAYLAAIKREIDKQTWALENNFLFVELGDEDLRNLSRRLFQEKYGITL